MDVRGRTAEARDASSPSLSPLTRRVVCTATSHANRFVAPPSLGTRHRWQFDLSGQRNLWVSEICLSDCHVFAPIA
jgi:hypothetical protein